MYPIATARATETRPCTKDGPDFTPAAVAIGDAAPVPVPVAGVVGVATPEETTSYIRSTVREGTK
jgi:hypothetical protein